MEVYFLPVDNAGIFAAALLMPCYNFSFAILSAVIMITLTLLIDSSENVTDYIMEAYYQ